MVNVFAGVTMNEEVVVAAARLLIRVIGPVVVPATTAKVSDPVERLESGWEMIPPPSFDMETLGAAPKLAPVTVTKVPIGPVVGLKPVMVGGWGQPKFSAALISI